MISRDDIKNLAQLSRLKLTDAEMDALEKESAAILDYVGQVSKIADGETGIELTPVRNVMRDDAPRAADDIMALKREMLLAELPRREDDYAVVRKIIQKDE